MKKILASFFTLLATAALLVGCQEPKSESTRPNNPGFNPDMVEINYYGNLTYQGNFREWELFVVEDDVNQTQGEVGRVMSVTFLTGTDMDFKTGVPTGRFEVNFSHDPNTYKAGDAVDAGYYSVTDNTTEVHFVKGYVEIVSYVVGSYNFICEFETESGEKIEFETLRIATGSNFRFKDESYSSDLTADREIDDVVAVRAQYEGDVLGNGVGVWKLHVYGDGADVNDDGFVTSKQGSYTGIQFYSQLGVENLAGTYEVVKNMGTNPRVGTIDFGRVEDGMNMGTWFSLFDEETGAIVAQVPAHSGTMEISHVGGDVYDINFKFGDDNPYDGDTHYLSANFSKPVAIKDNTLTGDYDNVELTYAVNKYSDKSRGWEAVMTSNEYIESEGQEGHILEFVMLTTSDDSFYQKNVSGEYFVEDNLNPRTITKAVVKSFEKGVMTESALTGGSVEVKLENNKYVFEVNVKAGDQTIESMFVGDIAFCPEGGCVEQKPDFIRMSMNFVGNKLHPKIQSWEVVAESQEFITSGGKDGICLTFALMTREDDSFANKFIATMYYFDVVGTDYHESLVNGVLTTYTAGVAKTNKITDGTLMVTEMGGQYTFTFSLEHDETLPDPETNLVEKYAPKYTGPVVFTNGVE